MHRDKLTPNVALIWRKNKFQLCKKHLFLTSVNVVTGLLKDYFYTCRHLLFGRYRIHISDSMNRLIAMTIIIKTVKRPILISLKVFVAAFFGIVFHLQMFGWRKKNIKRDFKQKEQKEKHNEWLKGKREERKEKLITTKERKKGRDKKERMRKFKNREGQKKDSKKDRLVVRK